MPIKAVSEQVENLQDLDTIQELRNMRKELFKSLYVLVKIDFFAEKYLVITEDIFDTDSILVVRSLVQIWLSEETKKRSKNTMGALS